jgi:hypothetical protein
MSIRYCGAQRLGSPGLPRALVLSYYFPPLGGAGVQRTTKLLKHLPSFGWDAIVVAGPLEASLAWTPHDPTLAHDVPVSTAGGARRL